MYLVKQVATMGHQELSKKMLPAVLVFSSNRIKLMLNEPADMEDSIVSRGRVSNFKVWID